MSKQSKRNKIARLRAALHNGKPLAIDARALGAVEEAIQSGDLKAIRASLSFGGEMESTAAIINRVAVIPVMGVLRDQVDFMVRWAGSSCYQLIERDLKQALANDTVKAVLMYCDSPGGAAIGVKRVADLIYASRGDKPIRAYVQGLCGSACYYLAAACDRIDATADSLVGSVGTIFPHVEGSKWFDEMGLTYTVFTNKDSPKKGHGNQYEPLSDAARQTIQQFVESYGRPFIEDVARYRGVTPDQVIANYGQGDALRADVAVRGGVIDGVVDDFQAVLSELSAGADDAAAENRNEAETPVVTGQTHKREMKTMNERIKAQLFAQGLIDSLETSDAECQAALRGWFRAIGAEIPASDEKTLEALQTHRLRAADAADEAEDDDGEEPDGDEGGMDDRAPGRTDLRHRGAAGNVRQAHQREQGEARLVDLRSAAQLINETAGCAAVSGEMVLDALADGLTVNAAVKAWNKSLAESEPSVPTQRIRVSGEGADRYAADIVDALVYRASDNRDAQLSDGAAALVGRPLWAVAAECLQLAGQPVDIYGERSLIAQQAMEMGPPGFRHTFFSGHENRQYIQAAGGPYNRPGDFPNILSGLANKFLDSIELDQDYSYPAISAMLPGGLKDFKPAMMVNKGIVEELDEVSDSEQFKELGLSEEVLSYIYLRRFGNKFGWTPRMIADDDLGAFVEGMLGLAEAWEVTQNRLVVDLFTSNPTLLDGSALFADRTDVGGAANNNDRTSGGTPDDAEWEAMETLYADIGGVGTQRRVRGMLNTIFCPTGSVSHEAHRYFAPLNIVGEVKQAATSANLSIWRGKVNIVPESELRNNSTLIWYGLRSPNRLNTATVVRGYFNGFGTMGRRERWYDPNDKTTWVSLEGRIGVAIKNWRYAVRNAGE